MAMTPQKRGLADAPRIPSLENLVFDLLALIVASTEPAGGHVDIELGHLGARENRLLCGSPNGCRSLGSARCRQALQRDPAGAAIGGLRVRARLIVSGGRGSLFSEEASEEGTHPRSIILLEGGPQRPHTNNTGVGVGQLQPIEELLLVVDLAPIRHVAVHLRLERVACILLDEALRTLHLLLEAGELHLVGGLHRSEDLLRLAPDDVEELLAELLFFLRSNQLLVGRRGGLLGRLGPHLQVAHRTLHRGDLLGHLAELGLGLVVAALDREELLLVAQLLVAKRQLLLLGLARERRDVARKLLDIGFLTGLGCGGESLHGGRDLDVRVGLRGADSHGFLRYFLRLSRILSAITSEVSKILMSCISDWTRPCATWSFSTGAPASSCSCCPV